MTDRPKELKACPFCGSDDVFKHGSIAFIDYVTCQDCNARAPLDVWNNPTRTPDTERERRAFEAGRERDENPPAFLRKIMDDPSPLIWKYRDFTAYQQSQREGE